MKTLTVLLLVALLATPLFGQVMVRTVNVTPVLNMTQYDSVITRVGWDTLRTTVTALKFDSASVQGKKVAGPGIQWGTTVTYVNQSNLKMSKKAIEADSTTDIQIGHFTSAAYASGDCMGLAFVVTDSLIQNAPYRELSGCEVIDENKQSAAFDVFLFDTTLTAGTDTATFNPDSTLMARHYLGAFSVAAADYKTVSSQTVADVTGIGLLLPRGPIYGQLVSRGTPTYISSKSLRLKFLFKVAQ